jgi:hypothetical protein
MGLEKDRNGQNGRHGRRRSGQNGTFRPPQRLKTRIFRRPGPKAGLRAGLALGDALV